MYDAKISFEVFKWYCEDFKLTVRDILIHRNLQKYCPSFHIFLFTLAVKCIDSVYF